MEHSTPSKERFAIDGRTVYVNRKTRTQTVAICTAANVEGTYEVRYRLPVAVDLSVSDLANMASVAALAARLEELGAEAEDPSSSTPKAPLPLVPAPSADDPWVRAAAGAVDRAVDALLTDFLDAPYLHRVEHSLHAELFGLLKREAMLAEHAHLSTGQRTQLVHKEWPETISRDRDGVPRKRGNFDLAILGPAQLAESSLEQFRNGRIAPAIAIEIGLDYGRQHFEGDVEKFKNSEVAVPYLIHLTRLPMREAAAIERVVSEQTGVRVAYVHHDVASGRARIKRVADAICSDHS